MTGRKAIAGLSLLCALVFCALAAPGAMALNGTTAYECKPVKAGKTGFTDEHCTKAAEPGKASFEHVLIPEGSTAVAITNNETGATYPVVRLRGELAGVKVELEAKKFTSCKESTIENKENAKKQMEVAGKGCGEFSEITTLKPAKCSVKSIALKAGLIGTTEVVEKKEEAPHFTGTGYRPPPEGGGEGVFASFTLEGSECFIKGLTLEVKGSVKASMPTEGVGHGPTLKFTTAETEKTLSIGGKSAAFEGTFTMRMQPGEKGENPISLTLTAS